VNSQNKIKQFGKQKINGWSIRADQGATNTIDEITINNKATNQIRLISSKRQNIEQHIPSSEPVSRKKTEIYMITTKMASSTHIGVAAIKECTLGSFTSFTLSTMIKQP